MFFLIIILYFILTIVEERLSSNWNPTYFQYGLPLVRKKYSVPYSAPDLNDQIQHLGKNLPRNRDSDVQFKGLNSHELAFRVKYNKTTRKGKKNREAPGHGFLRYDPIEQTLSFTGYFSWGNLILPLFLGGPYVAVFLGAPSTFAPSIIFPAIFIMIASISSYGHWKDYGRIDAAIQRTFQDQLTISVEKSSKALQYSDYQVADTKMPDIQTYDPFTTPTSNDSSETLRIILITILVGMLIFMGFVVFLFLSTYSG